MYISGAGIKILIITNIQSAADTMLDSIDFGGATVVSREVSGDVRSLAKSTAALFVNGGYDFAIAITDNTVAASIALNKYDGITSVVCHDAEEARSARSQGVNVVIIKQNNTDIADSIVNAFAKGMGLQLKIKIPSITLTQTRPQPEEAKETRQVVAPKKQQAMPQAAQQERPERLDGPAQASRPGVMGWIKDSLGIIDETEPQSGHAPAQKGKKKGTL